MMWQFCRLCRLSQQKFFGSFFQKRTLSCFLLVFATTPAAAAGLVVTSQHLASDVGAAVLASGGNAVDAAVAIGYALAVVDPCCGNIGGGGFMTIHRADGSNHVIDFRERAPLRATPTLFQDAAGNVLPDASRRGYLAVAVPGTVAGLERAREAYGTQARAALMAPAIALAENGFLLDAGDTGPLGYGTARFNTEPNVAAIFTHDGAALRPGDRLVQHDLAATLRQIATDGPRAFYEGPVADTLVRESATHGGILSLADLSGYTAVEQPPVSCDYRGWTLVAPSPPSSGGVVMCEILGILQAYPLGKEGRNSAAATHLQVEAERAAYLDRNTVLGDPDFVADPVAMLLSPTHLRQLRDRIQPVAATPSAALAPVPVGTAEEKPQTTSYSVVDGLGNAVAVTYTINGYFGAGVIAGRTGFFLNNEMDDFTSKVGTPNMFGLVQGLANRIQPGKRPLSSVAPSIVLRNGRVALVLGAPGGSRIPTEVLSVLQGVVDYGLTLQQAVDAPRLHMQYLPDTVYLEPDALAPETKAALVKAGYNFTEQHPWGLNEAIEVMPDGSLQGATDARRPGGKVAAVK